MSLHFKWQLMLKLIQWLKTPNKSIYKQSKNACVFNNLWMLIVLTVDCFNKIKISLSYHRDEISLAIGGIQEFLLITFFHPCTNMEDE